MGKNNGNNNFLDIFNRISSFMTFLFLFSQRFYVFTFTFASYFGHKSFVIYIHYCRHYVNYFVEKVSNNIKVFKVPYYFVFVVL